LLKQSDGASFQLRRRCGLLQLPTLDPKPLFFLADSSKDPFEDK
jgi:hypothetical protein